MDPKFSRLVTYDEGTSPTKSCGTSIAWSRDKSKNVVSPLSQGLWSPNLAGWCLRIKGTPPTMSRDTSASWSLDK